MCVFFLCFLLVSEACRKKNSTQGRMQDFGEGGGGGGGGGGGST